MKVSKTELINYLKKIHLEGKITEAVFDNNFLVQTSGAESQIIISGKADIPLTQKIGVMGIDVLIRLLSSVISTDDIVLTITGNKLVFGNNDEGKVSYLLSDPELVEGTVTSPGGTQALIDKFKQDTTITVALPQTFMQNFKKLYSLLKNRRVTFTVKDKELSCTLGGATEHNAKLTVANVDSEDFTVSFDASIFDAIFKNVDYTAELFLGKGTPAIIKQTAVEYAVSPFAE